MSKKKTDWEILRGLADYILSLGEFKHNAYVGNKEVDWYDSEIKNCVRLYTDGNYISCSIKTNGVEHSKVAVHNDSCQIMPPLDKDIPNITDLPIVDVRKLNLVYRAKLRPLEKDKLTRANETKLLKIAKAEEELAKLKQEVEQ